MVDAYIFTDSFLLSFYLISRMQILILFQCKGLVSSLRKYYVACFITWFVPQAFWFGVVIFRKMINVSIFSIK
jgi:hypothetical protein